MQEINVPMVVTHDGGNRIRARPMAAHLDPDANGILFLTDAEATEAEGATPNCQTTRRK